MMAEADHYRPDTIPPTKVQPKNTCTDFLEEIALEDAAGLKKAQESYGDSWKKRGGVGAFMMLARKWDRLENAMTSEVVVRPVGYDHEMVVSDYDIFARVTCDTRAEGLIDDIRDLRRYLMLVEAEMRLRGSKSATSKHRDN